jgi:hypothetical protein
VMDGAAILSQGLVHHEPNLEWYPVAVGNFSGGAARNQVLWRKYPTGEIYLQTISLSAGVFSTSGGVIYQEPNFDWRLIGAADFDGDGKSDILWRNEASGAVHVMLMKGGAIASQATIYNEARPAWQIVAMGDYTGDYRADILWRNSQTGQVYRQRMNGTTIMEQGFVFTEPDLAWKVLGSETYPR